VALTTATATPRDIWPDGCPHDAETEAEIISVARYIITEDDVQRSGLTYAPWYIPYYLAEGVVQKRREVSKKLKQRKREQRLKKPQTPPPPQPVAKGSMHPSAVKWARWPTSRTEADAEVDDEAYRKHCEDWRRKRGPLAVYRPELDDRQPATISDARKLYRETMIHADIVGEALVFYVKELSKRIKALEERPDLKYRGIWSEGEDYDEASFVTHQGSLWIAKVKSKGVRPGDGACWQLCAKKGRDGRHAPRDGRDAT
jgi:hypothetical protein